MVNFPFFFFYLASAFQTACEIHKGEALLDRKLSYKCQLLGEMGH